MVKIGMFSKFADFIVFGILSIPPATTLGNAMHFFVCDVMKIFLLITVAVFIAGLVRSYVKPYHIQRLLSNKPRFLCYALASFFGAVTPFCCCSGISVFTALLLSGVSLDIAIAFLITSPLINEMAVALLISSMGLGFTVLYVSVSVFMGICGGYVFHICKLHKFPNPVTQDYTAQHQHQNLGPTFIARTKFAYYETVSMLKRICVYVIVGAGMGAVMYGYIPQEFFLKYGGVSNDFAVPVVVMIGIPLFSSIVGIIPTIEVLLSRGIPVGTTIAFTIAVVAISIPQLIILHKILKPRIIVCFVTFLFTISVIVGYTLNFLLPHCCQH